MIKYIPTIQDTIAYWQQKPDYQQQQRERLATWSVCGLCALVIVVAVLGMIGRL